MPGLGRGPRARAHGGQQRWFYARIEYSPQVSHHTLLMQEQVTDFLAGIRAQAVELQTDAERDVGLPGLKRLLPVVLATLLSLFSLAIPILPEVPRQRHARLPLPRGAVKLHRGLGSVRQQSQRRQKQGRGRGCGVRRGWVKV